MLGSTRQHCSTLVRKPRQSLSQNVMGKYAVVISCSVEPADPMITSGQLPVCHSSSVQSQPPPAVSSSTLVSTCLNSVLRPPDGRGEARFCRAMLRHHWALNITSFTTFLVLKLFNESGKPHKRRSARWKVWPHAKVVRLPSMQIILKKG